MNTYDYIVIGGGSGGIASANRAAEYGAKVAVIESDELGGTCVNRGCVPKKVSWYAAKIHETLKRYSPAYGFQYQDLQWDFQQFLEARDGYVSRSQAGYYQRFEKNNITLIRGAARFLDKHTIEVNGESYQADKILIATGGKPAIPSIKGGEYLENSDDFFNWQELPEKVAVIGAGYIAVEFSQLLQSFGVDTILITRYEKPLRTFDDMLSEILLENMKAAGIQHIPNITLEEIRKVDGQIEGLSEGEVIFRADRAIIAAGRQANVDGLNLAATDIRLDERGRIAVDENHQTAAEGVYAVGDVISRIDLTPVAIRAGRQVAEYLFNQAESAAIDYTNIPTVLFTHPAIGTIGYTEKEAEEVFGEEAIKVYTNTFFSMYASAGGHREINKFKLVCQGPNEVVVGMHGIGEGVDEMIQGFGVAMKMGASKAQFDEIIAIHPTGSEEWVTMR